jgi:quercetin dioxygenase-like cupin family protein
MNILQSILVSLAVFPVGVGSSAWTQAAENPSPAAVTYFSHEKVDAAFAKGGVLLGGESGHGSYRVLTARRDRPGEVEIHNLDTDIIYVVTGSATLVTGGTTVEAKPTETNEVRGKEIQGGTPHQLTRGDVIIVPHGVPHWFKEVSPPFLYFVVKVH